ncbi:MAG: hypothetical protein F6K65_01125 [Moorea sp. SIO3C2]|nr:hypothetical protein [Moorena sp. SIO3C2]
MIHNKSACHTPFIKNRPNPFIREILLPAPCSLLPAPCSLLPAPCSLLPAPCSLCQTSDIA